MVAGEDDARGKEKRKDGRHAAAAVRRRIASSGGGGVAAEVRRGALVGWQRRLRSRLRRPGRLG
jgi:hypothetical protein